MSISDCSRASASTESFTITDIFRAHIDELSVEQLSYGQIKLINDMVSCRTASLGGHLYVCPECGLEQPQYNSCRNRGCPNCQALRQAKWIEERKKRFLPVGHHHIVFTFPSELRPLALYNQSKLYGLLFHAAKETLAILAQDILGAQLAITMVLHTWTRRLLLHPHVHVLVSAGGLRIQTGDEPAEWIERLNYLFPVARMKALFRSQVLAGLQRLRDEDEICLPGEKEDDRDKEAWGRLIRSLPKKDKWVVYIEPPFGSSLYLLTYLGRYTHQIAISNKRLIDVTDHNVTFRVRDDETCTLEALEFMQRFLLHVLPRGFRKIRHYGLYAPSNVNGRLEQARELISGDVTLLEETVEQPDVDVDSDDRPKWARLLEKLTGKDPLLCPRCRKARLLCTETLPRSPPGAIE
jgi:hypothetical protein